MNPFWLFFLGITLVGIILVCFGVLMLWWFKLRKITKDIPRFESVNDLKMVNYDEKAKKRYEFLKGGEENGATSDRARSAEKTTERSGGGASDSDDEIRRIKEEIARRERELRREPKTDDI